MIKSIYITGCLGFMASHFTEACLKRGWRVYGVDKCTYAANLPLLEKFQKYPEFTFCKAGIESLTTIYDCDYVVNMAAETHVDNSIIEAKDFVQSNILGTQNILDLIRMKRDTARRPILLHFSTDEVYGDLFTGSFNEDTPLNPSNPYAATKAAADLLIQAWGRTYGCNYIILRPTNNYGEYQYPEKLIPLSVKNLMRGRKIRLHNQGEPVRVWLHAEDTADAIFKMIDQEIEEGIFNLSGPDELKNIKVVETIIKAFHGEHSQWKDHLDFGYSRPGQDVRYSVEDSKMRALSWSPQKRILGEIPKLVEHFKEYYRW